MSQQQIFNVLVDFFESDEWEFQGVPGMPILSMGFAGQNGKWLCYAQAREPQQQVVFYSVLSVNAPENRRQIVSEFITRANYGMIIGNFEMDFDDGEIRYKTSLDIEGYSLTTLMLRQLVYANLVITDRYLPGLMRVIYSDALPKDVLDEIEMLDDDADWDGDDFLALDDEADDADTPEDDEPPSTNGNGTSPDPTE